LIGRGACLYAKGDFDKALVDLDAAVNAEPKNATALLNRANAWRGKKDYVRAKADYDAALALKPDLASARKGAADVSKILERQAANNAAPPEAATPPHAP